MTTTKKNRSKNKKMKLYKNIEGGVVGKLKINEDYLLDRIKYTYDYIFPNTEANDLFGDDTESPIYFLFKSAIGTSSALKEGYTNVMGTTLGGFSVVAWIPFRYYSQFYNNYIAGDFTRAVKYDYAASSALDQMAASGEHFLKTISGRGKPTKYGGYSVGTLTANYNEFTEKTDPDARLAVLTMKQFDVFMDYVNKVGSEYREDLLKFLKKNIDKPFIVGYSGDIDFNDKTRQEWDEDKLKEILDTVGPLIAISSIEQLKKYIEANPTASGFIGAKKTVNNKKDVSYYGDIPPPPDDADEATKKAYTAKIKSVNTTLYNTIRNQQTDNPNNPSLIIPSAFWFFGDTVKVTGDLDVRTTLPQSLYTEMLAVQKEFEIKVFNNKTRTLLDYLRLRLKDLYADYKAQGEYIDEVMEASQGIINADDSTTGTDTERLKAEYDRQIADDTTLHLTEKTFNEETMDKRLITKKTEKGIKYVLIKTKDIKATGNKSAYQEWLTIFVRSEEYADFIKGIRSTTAAKRRDDLALEEVEKILNPTINIDELARTKSFYNADVFESEDPDSINYDLIQQLREQEESFNKTIADLKTPFEAEQAEQRKKNEESLALLKAKIGPTEEKMYKELDAAMATNRQNRVDRKNEDVKTKLAEKTIEEEEGALASLKNYKNCSGAPPREPPPQRIYQDVNIQDIIKKAGKELLGGKKRMSIAQQVYLLNKRFIGDYSDERPNIKYNSAKKEGGATDRTNTRTYTVDPSLGIQGSTFNYIDYSELEKEIADMQLATDLLGFADNFAGYIPVVGDALSAGITIANMVMAGEIAKKEREIEEKQKENERVLDSFFAWKDNMQEQMVLTLSTQEDPKIYAKLKKIALDAFRTMDPDNAPSAREVKMYGNRIDSERNNILATRKAITDQMTENSSDILDVIGDTLDEQDNARTALIDEGFKARKKIVDDFTTKLKDYVKKFIEEQLQLAKQDGVADMQAREVAAIVDKKQEELNDEAEDIAQLKGYSGCKSNVKSQEQMEEDALNELKEKAKQQEEDLAQGKITMQGLGKRYKKNSIANQVYLLNMRYINSF